MGTLYKGSTLCKTTFLIVTTDFSFLDALASLESMMSVIVSLTENNWVTDRKFSLLQDVI